MASSYSRLAAGAIVVLCLSVAAVSAQGVRVIKLVPTGPNGSLELTTAANDQRPTMLPPPLHPPEPPLVDTAPSMPSVLPYTPPRVEPPPMAPSPPPLPLQQPPQPPPVAPHTPPAYTPPTAESPPGAWYQQPAYQRLTPIAAPASPPVPPRPSADDNPQYWFRAEALLWWMRSQPAPPLVTSAPAGAVGALGVLGTKVVQGNEGLNGEGRGGGRFTGGWWFTPSQVTGVSADYFYLHDVSANPQVAFNGATPLGRPYTDALTGKATSELIGSPGANSGLVTVRANGSPVEGAGVLLRQRLLLGTDPECVPVFRLDAVIGYRYLGLGESLEVQADSVVTGTGLGQPPGSLVAVRDVFQTRNTFHGFDFGLASEINRGGFSLGVTTKVAAGTMDERVTILGSRTLASPAGSLSVAPGGLLAQSTNAGVHRHSESSLVSELEINLGWRVSPYVRLFTGYNLIYVSDLARPGDHIDLAVNPNLLSPPANADGANRPSFVFRSADLWLQGAKLGVELQY